MIRLKSSAPKPSQRPPVFLAESIVAQKHNLSTGFAENGAMAEDKTLAVLKL